MKRLNLGCGTKVKEGWVNLDSMNLPGVDVVHDMEKLPLPFRDEEFDEILGEDVLEHLEYIPVLKDLQRVLKKGGTLTIRVPHFTARNNFIDPTHKKMFSINTFDFFVKGTPRFQEREYYLDFAFSGILYSEITFQDPRESKLFWCNKLVSRWVNKNQRRKELYESTFLSRFFPAYNMVVKLVK